jgi:hypothetical protein
LEEGLDSVLCGCERGIVMKADRMCCLHACMDNR